MHEKNWNKNLSITEKDIDEWVRLWCETTLGYETLINCNRSSKYIEYCIGIDGLTKIQFYKKNDGRFSINYNVGNKLEETLRLSEYIVQRAHSVYRKSPFSNGFSVLMEQKDFEAVIEYLKERENVALENFVSCDEPQKANYVCYKYRGETKDTIVITYYPNTKRMQLQGKPLQLFNEIVELVCDEGTIRNDVIDAQIRYCNLNIEKDEVETELKEIIGDRLYDYLPSTQRAMLSSAVLLGKVDASQGDYSYIIMPACRAFEGYIKKIFAEYGFTCEKREQLGKFFKWPDDVTPEMHAEYAVTIDDEVNQLLTSLFKFYSQYRHPYMHSTGRDFDTTVIGEKKDALEKLNEIITYMRASFDKYKMIK